MLARAVKEMDGERVIVRGSFPVRFADQLRAEDIGLEIDPQLVERDRRCKTESEIVAIVEVQRATERAVGHAIDILAHSEDRNGLLHLNGIPLTSERIRAEMEIALLKEGMDCSSGLIVAGGPGAADPHWEGEGPLRTGESIVMDVFPRSKRTRYFSDMTRTVVKGDPGAELRRMYATVLRAQEAALGGIRAGANGRDVHAAVEAVFSEEGFTGDGPGARYIHGTGHGVGLDIHESGPQLRNADCELLEGDVVTVEPGLYDPDLGAVRIEDIVVVTRDGCRNLTEFPKRFEI
jgi:Xaa-Pro aminopeptidase